MKRLATGALLGLLLAQPTATGITITIKNDKEITAPAPICVPLTLPPDQAKWEKVAAPGPKGLLWGQITSPGLVTAHIQADKGVRRDLHFILKSLSE